MPTSVVETLTDSVRRSFARNRAVVPGARVADWVTEPAARFAAEQAVGGGALSHNPSTVTALRFAVRQLDDSFHVELAG